MTEQTPVLDPDKPEKVVTLKPLWWDPDRCPEFTLKPVKYGSGEWAVFLPDGAFIGTVTRYEGSIDTPLAGTRLRHEGKRRTLWAFKGPRSRYTMWEQVSRADCLRRLYNDHKRGPMFGGRS